VIRATISDVTPQTSLTAQDRWGRTFASLVFSTVQLDNTCALAWYVSHLNPAPGLHPSRGTHDPAGPDATRAQKGAPTRRSSLTEGDR